LIRLNRKYRSWRHGIAEHRRRELAQIAMRRRVVDECTFLLLLDDIWFRVETDVLPRERLVESVVDGNPQRRVAAGFRYDVVLRRHISRASSSDRQQCEDVYGSGDLYAVCKRQIPTREIKAHRLR
jgi:DNA gyrase inhibitor GyrI